MSSLSMPRPAPSAPPRRASSGWPFTGPPAVRPASASRRSCSSRISLSRSKTSPSCQRSSGGSRRPGFCSGSALCSAAVGEGAGSEEPVPRPGGASFVVVRLLPFAPRGGLVVYLHLFLAEVDLEGLHLLDHPLAEPDLLFEHDPFGDHDLLFEDLHDDLFVAELGLGDLPVRRHALDLNLLAPLRHPHLLPLGAHALLDVHGAGLALADAGAQLLFGRSEEHTSELQSRQYLVCRLLLEKKKN